MYDVIVIGAGPAGANAALTAEHYGLNVLLIDEGSDAGGQVWRVKSKSILSAPVTETSLKGDKLRQRVKSSEVDILFETRVWQIEQNEEHVWQLGLQGVCERSSVSGKALIIATGAQERVIPLNGWTLPGVYGLAGATALFKEHMILPGKNTVVAGSGPLVFFVASEIIRLGGTLSAVVTLNSRFEWLKAAAEMISKPGLLWQGVKWVFKLHIKGIPLHWQSALSSINGNEYVQDVDIIKTTKYGYLKRKLNVLVEADSVCLGHGLIPAIEATRLAGADHHYDETLGGWVPTIDQCGRTTVKYLYACGDNAGILGVQAAPYRGELSAIAAVEDLTGSTSETINHHNKALKSLGEEAAFGIAATALTIPKNGLIENIGKNVEVCRCEGITREEIEIELIKGSVSPNSIKSGTRCGMGPCGGRFCSESLAMITESITNQSREEIGLPTARPPLRPVSMDEISDELDYDELPIPGVSPL